MLIQQSFYLIFWFIKHAVSKSELINRISIWNEDWTWSCFWLISIEQEIFHVKAWLHSSNKIKVIIQIVIINKIQILISQRPVWFFIHAHQTITIVRHQIIVHKIHIVCMTKYWQTNAVLNRRWLFIAFDVFVIWQIGINELYIITIEVQEIVLAFIIWKSSLIKLIIKILAPWEFNFIVKNCHSCFSTFTFVKSARMEKNLVTIRIYGSTKSRCCTMRKNCWFYIQITICSIFINRATACRLICRLTIAKTWVLWKYIIINCLIINN